MKVSDEETGEYWAKVPVDTDCPYPLSMFIDSDKFSAEHRVFLTAITEGVEPTTFRDVVAQRVWIDGMRKEIDSMELNHTWGMKELPQGKRAIDSKWVFKIKYRADGTIERYKARLVALENSQVEGVDYDETFAPVVKMSTVHLFLDVAAARK